MIPYMFKFIKSIFSKTIINKAELHIQNNLKGEVEIKYIEDILEITIPNDDNKEEKICLEIKKIENLSSHAKNEIAFTYVDKKFKLKGPQISVLYEKIHPLICNSYFFKSDNLSYFVYNSNTHLFESYPGPVTLRIYQDIFYYMRIENDSMIVHFEKINIQTQYYVDQASLSFVWSRYSDGCFYTFSIKYNDSITFLEFRSKYIECMYKSANKEAEHGDYFNQIGDIYAHNNNENENTILSTANSDEEETSKEEEILNCEENKTAVPNKDGASNEHLVVSENQCFITRGSSLGVFDLANNDIKFRAHIKNALNNPQKIITHSNGHKLIILDKDHRDRLELMDLNRGEVIEKWDVHEDMNDYFDSFKYNNNSTLVGISDSSIFQIDPRVKEKVITKKEYKTKNNFSCGISTAKGHVAIASKKGDLRLYDKLDKRAKTLLPGFGDEVIGIDTSKDGSMVVCTSKSYILVFNVNQNYSKNSKNANYRRLQLKPQHSTLLDEYVSFSTAKFDQNDTVIITSTGKFIIKWKVSDILKGDLYNYSIKGLHDIVVDEDFAMNGDDIIVALKNDVKKMEPKDLKKPKF